MFLLVTEIICKRSLEHSLVGHPLARPILMPDNVASQPTVLVISQTQTERMGVGAPVGR
jgi:hypothetical protein